MGAVQFGAPLDAITELSRLASVDVFFEGGTFLGGTSLAMSNLFKWVVTVENSPVMHERSKLLLSDLPNVRSILGDTRDVLANDYDLSTNTLFWLDSHWSGGDTYGENDECPLLDELALIFSSSNNNHIILIDDARLFMAPPPRPHKLDCWPSLKDIASKIPLEYQLYIFRDVIYILPTKLGFGPVLQEWSTAEWLDYVSEQKKENTFLNRVFRKARSLLQY